jgi:hypothetical protein
VNHLTHQCTTKYCRRCERIGHNIQECWFEKRHSIIQERAHSTKYRVVKLTTLLILKMIKKMKYFVLNKR